MMGMQGLERKSSMRRPRAWTSALEGMVVSGVACEGGVWRKDNVRAVDHHTIGHEKTDKFCCTPTSALPALSLRASQTLPTTDARACLGGPCHASPDCSRARTHQDDQAKCDIRRRTFVRSFALRLPICLRTTAAVAAAAALPQGMQDMFLVAEL
jgi:hypothetical protein